MLHRMRALIRNLLFRQQVEARLDDEIESAVEILAAEYARGGLDPKEARRRALIELGGREQVREQVRRGRYGAAIDSTSRNVRDAVRSLLGHPRYSLPSVVTLAIAIGMVASVVTTFNAIFFQPWPVPDADEVFLARPAAISMPAEVASPLSYAEFDSLRNGVTRAHLIASSEFGFSASISSGDRADSAPALVVSSDFFAALQLPLVHGRATNLDSREAVISYGLWQRLYGGDPEVVGTEIRLNNVPMTIVGILEPDFRGFPPRPVDIYIAFPVLADWTPTWDSWFRNSPLAGIGPDEAPIDIAGRLNGSWTRDDALAEFRVVYDQLLAFRREDRVSGRLVFFGTAFGERPGILDDEATFVFGLVFVGTILVLVLACANVASLQLARNLARGREFATRIALGASRRQIVHQLLTEGFVLAIPAGLGALGVAAVLPTMALGGVPDLSSFVLRPDVRVVAVAMVISVGAAIAISLLPALQTTRQALTAAGLQTGRLVTRPIARTRSGILGAQVAISIVLLLSAALTVRSVQNAVSPRNLGFRTETGVATLMEPDGNRFREQPEAFVPQLVNALAVSGLDAAFADRAPLTGGWRDFVRLEGQPIQSRVNVDSGRVSATFFRILGIPLVSGRTFDDDPERLEVVVNEAFVRRFLDGNTSPGSQIVIGDDVHTITGVAENARLNWVDELDPMVFMPLSDTNIPRILLPSADPESLAALEASVASIDSDIVIEIVTLEDTLWDRMEHGRFGMGLASILGLVALGLAVVGVFGIFGCYVEERKQEIGIRIALGAPASRVVGLLFRTARRALIPGIVVGTVLGIGAGVLLRGLLYGLSPLDPWSYAAVATILTLAAAIATWVPARRAVSIDPAVTLRSE